jgi:hypothetical protein
LESNFSTRKQEKLKRKVKRDAFELFNQNTLALYQELTDLLNENEAALKSLEIALFVKIVCFIFDRFSRSQGDCIRHAL